MSGPACDQYDPLTTCLDSGAYVGSVSMSFPEGSGTVVQPSMVHSMGASRDGSILAVGLGNADVSLCDIASVKDVARLHGHTGIVCAVEFALWNPGASRSEHDNIVFCFL